MAILQRPELIKFGPNAGLPAKHCRVKCACDVCNSVFDRAWSAVSNRPHQLCKRCITIKNNRDRSPEIKKKMISAAADVWRGKKREEVMGTERREIERKGQSLRNTGSGNPNFGGIYSKGFADHPLIGKWEDTYGEDRAKEMKQRASLRNAGSGNPMFGLPSPQSSGNGISGWWEDRLYFRSLLELAFIIKMHDEGKKLESAERACYRVHYVSYNGAKRTYTPDFIDADGTQYEVKPKNLLKSDSVIRKMQAAPHVRMITDDELKRPTLDVLDDLQRCGKITIDQSKLHKLEKYREQECVRNRRA